MRKRDENKEIKRQLLFNTAYELFLHEGFNNTTISDIVTKAGVAALNEGATTMISSSAKLIAVPEVLNEKVTLLNEGALALSNGSNDLNNGMTQLSAGVNQLQAGSQTLTDGVKAITSEIKEKEESLEELVAS